MDIFQKRNKRTCTAIRKTRVHLLDVWNSRSTFTCVKMTCPTWIKNGVLSMHSENLSHLPDKESGQVANLNCVNGSFVRDANGSPLSKAIEVFKSRYFSNIPRIIEVVKLNNLSILLNVKLN